jgi:hypothetical protein
MSSPANRSIPDLVSDAFSQLAKLVGNEIDLAKAELSDKVSQVGRAAVLIGAGVAIMLPAVVLLLFAVAAALVEYGFSEPVAYLITGIATAAIAGVLIGIGVSRLSGDAMRPSMTIEQLQRDKVAAKEMMQ